MSKVSNGAGKKELKWVLNPKNVEAAKAMLIGQSLTPDSFRFYFPGVRRSDGKQTVVAWDGDEFHQFTVDPNASWDESYGSQVKINDRIVVAGAA